MSFWPDLRVHNSDSNRLFWLSTIEVISFYHTIGWHNKSDVSILLWNSSWWIFLEFSVPPDESTRSILSVCKSWNMKDTFLKSHFDVGSCTWTTYSPCTIPKMQLIEHNRLALTNVRFLSCKETCQLRFSGRLVCLSRESSKIARPLFRDPVLCWEKWEITACIVSSEAGGLPRPV